MGLTAARGQLTNDGFKSTLVVIFFEGVGASKLMEVEKNDNPPLKLWNVSRWSTAAVQS